MKRAAESSSPRSRSRKKPVAPDDTAPLAPAGRPSASGKNVNPLEGSISLTVGVLFLVAALFPRTLKQLFLLALGGGLVYRGSTGKCAVYSALGIDTARQPLLKQLNDKYLAPALGEAVDS